MVLANAWSLKELPHQANKYLLLSDSIYFSSKYLHHKWGSCEMQRDGSSFPGVVGNTNGFCRQGQTNQQLSAVEERFPIMG